MNFNFLTGLTIHIRNAPGCAIAVNENLSRESVGAQFKIPGCVGLRQQKVG